MNRFMFFRIIGLLAAVASLVGSFFSVGLTELHTTKLMLVAALFLLGTDSAELRQKNSVPQSAQGKYIRIGLFVFCIGLFVSGFFN